MPLEFTIPGLIVSVAEKDNLTISINDLHGGLGVILQETYHPNIIDTISIGGKGIRDIRYKVGREK